MGQGGVRSLPERGGSGGGGGGSGGSGGEAENAGRWGVALDCLYQNRGFRQGVDNSQSKQVHTLTRGVMGDRLRGGRIMVA